jgi:hypothetical protein
MTSGSSESWVPLLARPAVSASEDSLENTAGQASSGTQNLKLPFFDMPLATADCVFVAAPNATATTKTSFSCDFFAFPQVAKSTTSYAADAIGGAR